MVYGDFKDLPRRTASDKVLPDKTFNIAKNPKYDGYQCRLASMVYPFCDKKSIGGVQSEIIPKQQLAGELHEPIFRKFKKNEKYTHLLKTIFGVLILQICN